MLGGDSEDVARHDSLVSLVEQMLSLHKQLPESRHAPRAHSSAAPDRGHGRADLTGARLYGLTKEEIGIVEAASR